MLGFLEKMTLHPEALEEKDALALDAAGVSRAAADDAITVGFCFNMIDRVADSLGFEVPSPEAFASNAKMLIKRGYQ